MIFLVEKSLQSPAGSVIPFTTQIDGSTEYTNAGARLGYGIPYGERGWLKAAFGFGFAQRRTSADVFTILLSNTIVAILLHLQVNQCLLMTFL